MPSTPCDIALRPSKEISDCSIAISKTLNGSFALSEAEYYPHISLYMLQLKLDDIVTAEKDLKIIASNFKIFQLQAIKYSQDEGFVDVEYKKLSSLTFLQEKVLAIFNSMRDGMREKDRARLATTEGLARENLQQYGYRGIGELFRPHLTLTRFSNKNEQQLTNMPKIDSFSGSFDRIGLFEMGESGTCRRKIFEIKLK